MTPEKYGIFCCPSGFQCQMSIYAHDGTVSLSQGGIEVGQGLFTKVITSSTYGRFCPAFERNQGAWGYFIINTISIYLSVCP